MGRVHAVHAQADGEAVMAGGLILRAYPRVPGDAVSYLDLDALTHAPYWARCFTRSSLLAWRLAPETVETAELLVSELITNSVKASSGAERISLALRRLSGRVITEVFDTSQRPPLLTDASADEESGRGLMLVQALSKEWGYYFAPSGGKVTYFILSG
jgi:anti-sigma regulatory factor (Ser/Thr protein kinase)